MPKTIKQVFVIFVLLIGSTECISQDLRGLESLPLKDESDLGKLLWGECVVRDCTVTTLELIEIDSSQYEGMYEDLDYLPLFSRKLILTGDIDQDSRIEYYGYSITPATTNIDVAFGKVYEYVPDFGFVLQHTYPNRTLLARGIADADNDGLLEIYFSTRTDGPNATWFDIVPYEQEHSDSLPQIAGDFFHPPCSGQFNNPTWGDLDQDGKTDFITYDLSGCETGGMNVLCEWDDSVSNYAVVAAWDTPALFTSGYTIADLDEDGYTEFFTGSSAGDVFMVESHENDSLELVWQDEVLTHNVYMSSISNDLDGNGKPELWMGGDAFYNGIPATLYTAFESTGDNSFEKRALLWIVGAFSFYCYSIDAMDMDHDGIDELVIAIDQRVLLFKHTGGLAFELWSEIRNPYAGQNSVFWCVGPADMNLDGFPEVLIGLDLVTDQYPYADKHTVVMWPQFMNSTNPNPALPGNFGVRAYPNPFNAYVTIEVTLPATNYVDVTIYNFLGVEVKKLYSGSRAAGKYTFFWDGKNESGKEGGSGTFIVVSKTGAELLVNKVVLIR